MYLRAFNGSAPLPDTKFQVSLSNANGREPRWRADGKELFYLESAPDQSRVRIMSLAMGAGANPAGSLKPLFAFRPSSRCRVETSSRTRHPQTASAFSLMPMRPTCSPRSR